MADPLLCGSGDHGGQILRQWEQGADADPQGLV
jgi:hypothetical protein